MALRQPKVLSRAVTAGNERTVNIPAKIVKIEVQIRDTESALGVDADGRIAWVPGGTADNGAHHYVDPDWWENVQLPVDTKIYLRSDIDNVFKILYWEGS